LALAVVTGAGLVSSGCAVGVDGTPVAAESVDRAEVTTCEYPTEPGGFDSVPTTPPPQMTDPGQRTLYQQQIDRVLAGRSKQRSSPEPAAQQPKSGILKVTLTTDQGSIPIVVDRADAPCNVAAVVSLAEHGYYDDTPCHRMTDTADLKVIQCGDPTGTGIGNPGWTSPDEPPTGLRPSGPVDPTSGAQTVIYPRGTVAIANRGPRPDAQNSGGGAQFFILQSDGTLPASYAVVGTVDSAGMSVVDKVFAGGIVPGVGVDPVTGRHRLDPQDGSPKSPLTIESVTVSD
jgi:peptidyl-prolyl cis-trans isomerase B (cyclophilin B)